MKERYSSSKNDTTKEPQKNSKQKLSSFSHHTESNIKIKVHTRQQILFPSFPQSNSTYRRKLVAKKKRKNKKQKV